MNHPSPTEKQLQAAVVQLAQTLGWHLYHTYNSRRSAPGFPDLVLWRDRLLFVELKTATGRLTRQQDETLAALRACGQEVHLIRPNDLDQLARALNTRAATSANPPNTPTPRAGNA